MSDPVLVNTGEQLRLEAMASPLLDYLMNIGARDAMAVLVALVSTRLLMIEYKPGKTALDTFDDHMVPAIRRTIEAGLSDLAHIKASMPETNRHD